MGPREPFPACRPETCRYTKPERLALAIVAAFLIRWRHPNLRALAAQKLPLVRPQRSNTTENPKRNRGAVWNFGDFHFSVSIASHGNKLLQLVNWDARCADSGIIYSITSSAPAPAGRLPSRP